MTEFDGKPEPSTDAQSNWYWYLKTKSEMYERNDMWWAEYTKPLDRYRAYSPWE